jgi:hypothetical protein
VNGSAGGGLGVYTVRLNGTSDKPITFKAYKNEKARINGSVHAVGGQASYVRFQGIEIAPTPTTRVFTSEAMIDLPALYITGTGCKFIDCYLHDLAQINPMGTGGFEMHGCLLGWNGNWVGGTQSNYTVYTHNHPGGDMLFRKNVFMPSASNYVFHGYSAANNVRDYYLEENTFFDGIAILSSGGSMANNHVLRNRFYHHAAGGAFRFESAIDNATAMSVECKNNYIGCQNVGGSTMWVTYVNNFDIQNNIMVQNGGGGHIGRYIESPISVSKVWDNNTYYKNGINRRWLVGVGEVEHYWASPESSPYWRTVTGFDTNSTMTDSLPADTVFVTKSDYSKRGFCTVYNWSQAASVEVDISSLGFEHGKLSRYFNAMNPDEEVVFYHNGNDQTITISMLAASWSLRRPTAFDAASWYTEAYDAFPTFGVFIFEQLPEGVTENAPHIQTTDNLQHSIRTQHVTGTW